MKGKVVAVLISFILLLILNLELSSARIEETCMRVEACVDGRDTFYISNSKLTMSHYEYDPIGQNGGCPSEYLGIIKIDGVNYPLSFDQSAGYIIDGKTQFDTPIINMLRYNLIQGRGTISSYHSYGIYIDDNGYGGPYVYIIDFCGEPTPNNEVPEFTLLGAGAIILAILAFLIWRRTK